VIVLDRPIKFEEVDAANIVFFARFAGYGHDAMEHFFDQLDGGYAGLIVRRRVGLAAVHVEMSFSAPARYGDTLRIETRVGKVGNRSLTMRYRMLLAGSGQLSAEVAHTVVTTDLVKLESCDMPADVRALLLQHQPP
jgi:4-hydroxybenzoyl-CoA thioesterase